MSTATIDLKFNAKDGIPTLENLIQKLKEIKAEAGKGISVKVNVKEMASANKQITDDMKEQKDLLKIINNQVRVAEQKYKRQVITSNELNREYKNAIKYLKDMEGQEVRLNQLKTKKWEIDKKALTEIDNQRVASEKMHSKVMSNIQAEANAMNKKFDVQKKMAEQYSKYGDINTAHAQAIKINQTKNIQSSTGYINEPPILPPSPTPKSGEMLNIAEYMARYAGAYAIFNLGKQSLGELYDFEKAVTQIGIAGELSQAQIQNLKHEYTTLAVQSGISAKEIAMAGETIIKTGQSVSDTSLILNEAVKLSKATGDNLSYTAESLSKILLTLQINAEHVTDVTNMMMSVANKTPASMQSLQEGLKQSNAGFANFLETTSKSGSELEDFKLKIIQTELAMMGGLSQLGRKGKNLPKIA